MKVRKWLSVLLSAVLILTLFTACGGNSSAAQDAVHMEMEYAEEAPAAMANGSLTDNSSTASTALPENRKWVITVNMSAETDDLDTMLQSLDGKISSMGGYVEDQRIHNGSAYANRRYRNAYLTIRIPAEDVTNFTEAVEGLSNVVSSEKNLEDITLRYVSTESRLAALQAEEARLLELMEQAETMADLLEIEARLTDVRYELENAASMLRIFDNQVSFATIHLDIEEVQEYTPVEEPSLWQRITGGFSDSLKGLGESLEDLLVFAVVAAPYLVVYGGGIGLFIFLVLKIIKHGERKKAKKNAPAAPWQPPVPGNAVPPSFPPKNPPEKK